MTGETTPCQLVRTSGGRSGHQEAVGGHCHARSNCV